MFEKYDCHLSGVRGQFDNYWHNIGISEAVLMVEKFSDDDWEALFKSIELRPSLWLQSCGETLGEVSNTRWAYKVLSILLKSDDPEVSWAAKDSIETMRFINGSAIFD